MNAKELKKTIKDGFGVTLHPSVQILMFDREYYTPYKTEVQAVLKKDKTDRTKWFPEFNDCDDKSWLLKSAFVKEAYLTQKNYAFGLAGGYLGGQHHMVNFFVDKRKQVWLVEPQTDKIYKPVTGDQIFIMIL